MYKRQSYSNVTYLVPGIILTDMNSSERDIASFFVRDLGLALVAETCPHRPQAFKKVTIGQALPWEENIFFFIFFLNEQVPGMSYVKKFTQMFEDLTAKGQYPVTINAQSCSYTETK